MRLVYYLSLLLLVFTFQPAYGKEKKEEPKPPPPQKKVDIEKELKKIDYTNASELLKARQLVLKGMKEKKENGEELRKEESSKFKEKKEYDKTIDDWLRRSR